MTDQTRNTDKSKATPDQPPSADSGALRGLELLNPSRRRLTAAGLAAPLLVSLAARPAWGNARGGCSLSGDLMSGNLSHPDKEYDCPGWAGCTPGFWRNNYLAWECTGYSPGMCTKATGRGGVNCKELNATVSRGHATSFAEVFDRTPPCPTWDDPSMMEVLQNCPGSLEWHAVAAVLNAACHKVDYGYQVDDIREAYQLVVDSALLPGEQVDPEKLKDIFDNLNNRDCPINAFGDCDLKETHNYYGECIDVLDEGSKEK